MKRQKNSIRCQDALRPVGSRLTEGNDQNESPVSAWTGPMPLAKASLGLLFVSKILLKHLQKSKGIHVPKVWRERQGREREELVA